MARELRQVNLLNFRAGINSFTLVNGMIQSRHRWAGDKLKIGRPDISQSDYDEAFGRGKGSRGACTYNRPRRMSQDKKSRRFAILYIGQFDPTR